jgi:hypothetical protein
MKVAASMDHVDPEVLQLDDGAAALVEVDRVGQITGEVDAFDADGCGLALQVQPLSLVGSRSRLRMRGVDRDRLGVNQRRWRPRQPTFSPPRRIPGARLCGNGLRSFRSHRCERGSHWRGSRWRVIDRDGADGAGAVVDQRFGRLPSVFGGRWTVTGLAGGM